MLRVVGLAFVAAVVASIASDGNQVVIGIAFFGVVALVAWSLLSGRTALRCPACGKRVKLGYSTCHHCGAQVGTPRPIGAPRHDPMTVLRECEACRTGIRPDASICPHCRTAQANMWLLRDGVWWDKSAGEWARLDQSRMQWVVSRAGPP